MNEVTKLSGLFTPTEISDLLAYCVEKDRDPLEVVREAVLNAIAS